ncbi:hypothetical protein B0H12DRAFT_1093891 [Mycena haematopus]|nr:hypothetical protein B0H12DRAFT_1093891 [Mycena haematopus]
MSALFGFDNEVAVPSSEYDVGEDATLHKAKQKFLQHLEEVDCSDGLTNNLVLKFHLSPEVESELNAFVD